MLLDVWTLALFYSHSTAWLVYNVYVYSKFLDQAINKIPLHMYTYVKCFFLSLLIDTTLKRLKPNQFILHQHCRQFFDPNLSMTSG